MTLCATLKFTITVHIQYADRAATYNTPLNFIVNAFVYQNIDITLLKNNIFSFGVKGHFPSAFLPLSYHIEFETLMQVRRVV